MKASAVRLRSLVQETPAVRLRVGLSDGESEARANAFAPRRCCSRKGLEKLRRQLGRNASTPILDVETEMPI